MVVDYDDDLAMLGALRADDDEGHLSDALDGDDLAVHARASKAGTKAIAKPDDAWIDMGSRAIARSAEGLTVVSTLEILPPYEYSV